MKELQEILQKIARLAPDEEAILATVVDVKGSSYRLAGARMLIDKNGNSIGTVSGGCLEADVLERAKRVLKTGEPAIITYDTTQNEDSVFGFGMGCRGVVQILLEPAKQSAFFEFLNQSFNLRKRGAMVTLISKPEDFAFALGEKAFIFSRENFSSELASLDIFKDILSDALQLIKENRSASKTYRTKAGELEFFIEIINPPVSLLLFGAGYDAIPLANFAKDLGWNLSIIDHRPAWANTERFPKADKIIVSRAENLEEDLFRDENSVAVIMTHNYLSDGKILPRLLASNCQYIGALGPKKRTVKLLEESGSTFDDQQLSRLYAPIGLDIGAETPEEIALAVVAEIRSVLAGKTASFLRDKKKGIHQ